MIQQTKAAFSAIAILYGTLVGLVISDSNSQPLPPKNEIVQLSLFGRIDSIDTTTTTTTITPTSNKLISQISSDKSERCPEWEQKINEYGLPVELFSYIAYRESRCNPKSINAKFDANGNVIWTLNKNGSIDRGLVQINSCWRSVTRKICGTGLNGLFDPDCNLSVAKYLYENGGASHWGFRD